MKIEKPLGSVLVPSQTGLGSISITDRKQQAGGELALDTIPWEGADYYTVAASGAKMAKAESMGWADPSFFPVAVFLSAPGHADELAALGVNTYVGIFGTPTALAEASAAGMFVFPQIDDAQFTPAHVNASDNCPGWMVWDEPDIKIPLSQWSSDVATIRALNDGRMIWTNFANGVLRTFWWNNQGNGPSEMPDAVPLLDACSVDKYVYTSEFQQSLLTGGGNDPKPVNWPGTEGVLNDAKCSAGYGWLTEEIYKFMAADAIKPVWPFIETKMPFLSAQDNPTVILYDQLEGAIWASIVHEARGIAFFQHNGDYPGGLPVNDPNTGLPHCTAEMSLVDCEAGLKTKVTTVLGQVSALAPVINTQSYVFDFGATGIDTMLKGKDGFAYIFASVALLASTGSKTFTLTGSGITGTSVEVLNESRSLSVSGGSFSDTFANEYTHHIYKVAI